MNHLIVVSSIDSDEECHYYVIQVPVEHQEAFAKLDLYDVLFPGGVEIVATEVSHVAGIPITKLDLPCRVDHVNLIILD